MSTTCEPKEVILVVPSQNWFGPLFSGKSICHYHKLTWICSHCLSVSCATRENQPYHLCEYQFMLKGVFTMHDGRWDTVARMPEHSCGWQAVLTGLPERSLSIQSWISWEPEHSLLAKWREENWWRSLQHNQKRKEVSMLPADKQELSYREPKAMHCVRSLLR